MLVRSSFGHGIPPNITRNQYDVPVPVLSNLLTSGKESEERLRAAECFIYLCTLSEIMGDVLPLVYTLHIEQKDIWRQIRRLETGLDEWERNLPDHLQSFDQESTTPVSGSSSLLLGYLSIRLLLCRIALHVRNSYLAIFQI
jgi:hypothetical protein